MEGKNIIIIGQQPWDTEIGSNCKNIATEMSLKNRVVYVNSPLDRITKIKFSDHPDVKKRVSIIKGMNEGLRLVQPNLWILYPDCLVESINWIQNAWLFDHINHKNNIRFARSIKTALLKLGIDKFILFNDSEMFKGFYLSDILKPDLTIYYSRDYMLGVDYWKRHGSRLEPLLIAKSGLCIANSLYLKDYCKQYNPNSFDVGQGCDLNLFQSVDNRNRPEELSGIKGPLVGYVGALQSIRLDVEIIKHIAKERSEWTLVLVGPEDDIFKQCDLHNFKNIIFTGAKPLEELSTYIQLFDVCINPQLVNEVTVGNYPRKIDEYLAMGKPTVATATRAMELFKDYVYLCTTPEDYIRYIELALQENSRTLSHKRQNFAKSHSWKNSVDRIYKAIEFVVNKTE